LNVLKIITPKLKMLLIPELVSVSWVLTLVPVISSPERKSFALATFYFCAYFLSYRKHPHQDLKQRIVFGFLAYGRVTSLPKKLLILAPLFYRASFPR
jgi:hypothetical protein